MKKILGVVCLFVSVSAMAASVKITSFNYVRTSQEMMSPLAELCGSVEGATAAPTFVQVIVDHKSSKPAYYNTVAGANGKFCTAVITYRGTAEAVLIGGEKATATLK
ncbi:MAG: hypothetical protein V4598_08620 [Bdellovibrionota bacterium]